MSIPYALFKNNLTPSETDFAASVQTKGSLDFDALSERIAEQDNTVGMADIRAVLETLERVCESALIEGNRVNLGGLVQLFPRVRGVFDGPTDRFDPERHRVDVGANPGQRIRNSVRRVATVEKTLAISPKPELLQYLDVGSQQVDSEMTPASIGKISGGRLKYNSAQPDEGVFFVPVNGGADTKVLVVSQNLPGELQFLNPELPPGDYQVEVRSRVSGGTELRIGRLDKRLTVA